MRLLANETDVTLSQGSQLVIPETQLDNIAANSQSQMVMSEVEGTLNKNDLVESMSRDISEEQTLFEAPNSPGNTADRNMVAISTPTDSKHDDEKPEDKQPTHSDDEKTEDKEATHSDDEKPEDKQSTHSDDEKPEDKQSTHSDDEKPEDKQSTHSDDEKPEDKQPTHIDDEKPEDKQPTHSDDEKPEDKQPTHSDEKRDDAQSPQELSTINSNPAEKQKQQQVSPME